jgi:hypothetical protein
MELDEARQSKKRVQKAIEKAREALEKQLEKKLENLREVDAKHDSRCALIWRQIENMKPNAK